MNIYRIRPEAREGELAFRSVVHKPSENSYIESRDRIARGEDLLMQWCDGDDELPCADFIPGTAPGAVCAERVIPDLQHLFPSATRFFVRIDDGHVFVGIKERNFTESDSNIDHLFMMYPRHSYSLATEVFKQAWERLGFTGATFVLVDELADERFAAVAE